MPASSVAASVRVTQFRQSEIALRFRHDEITAERQLESTAESAACTAAMVGRVSSARMRNNRAGSVDAFKERGLRCPEDISLVGRNDMPLMDVVSPPLTTVRIEHREMGRIAARMLAEQIKGGSPEIRHVVLRPELVVRGSTGNSTF